MSSPFRGLAVALLGLVVLLGACGSTAAPVAPAASSAGASPSVSAAPVKIVVSYGEVVAQELPLWIAKESGIFAQQGLDVDMRLIVSSAEVAALIAGETQIANPGGPQVLNVAATAADIVVAAVPVALSPFNIFAPASISSMEGLKGKNVGISKSGSPSDIAMRVALVKSGLDPQKDVRFVEAGSTQARTAAMIQGTIQAGAANPVEAAILKKQGLHSIFDLAALKEPFAETTVVAKKAWVAQHREVMQKYVDSIVLALKKERLDKPFAVSVLKKYLKSDDDAAMSATYDAYATLFSTYPEAKAEQFQTAKNVLASVNPAVSGVDITKLIDPSFVDSAKARKLGG